MGFLIFLIIMFLIIVVLIIFGVNRNVNQKVNTPSEDVDLVVNFESPDFGKDEEMQFMPIMQDSNNDWLLNPGANFKLTLQKGSRHQAQMIRDILDDDSIWSSKKIERIVALFAEYNLKVKEVESYKKKYSDKYFSKIEEQKQAWEAWETLGDLDKEDLLIDFRKEAVNSLHERADCNLVTLFEKEPKDITLDDELIKAYGFINMQTYLRYAGNMDQVYCIPNDDYLRPIFEDLIQYNLAIRGVDIPKEELLLTLTLKNLNEIANNPDKKYYRKRQAVDYILTKDKLVDLGKYLSFREMFKLQPLPNKYEHINLQDISDTWSYHSEEVSLLVSTYASSLNELTSIKGRYASGYEVVPGNKEYACPCAVERSAKTYTIDNLPNVPNHIGCNCYLRSK